jgi:hypothetical protein
MPTTVTCSSCKSRFPVKPEYAGKRLKCGKCGVPIAVPAATAAPANPFIVACDSCGARYSLKPEHAGKRLKCGKCGREIAVPATAPAAAPVAPTSPAKPKAAPAPKKIAAASSAPAGLAPLPEDDFWSSLPAANAAPAAAPRAAAQNPLAAAAPADGFWDDLSKGPALASAAVASPLDASPAARPASPQKRKSAGTPLLVQAGVIMLVGFAAAPVIYYVAQCFVHPIIALLVAALAINFVAGVGSFTVACMFFNQKMPDFGEIIRVVRIGSTGPMGLLIVLALCGCTTGKLLLSAVTLLVPGILFSAWRCLNHLKMPTAKAVLVAVTYNLGAVAMTGVGFSILAAIFVHGGILDDLKKQAADAGENIAKEVAKADDEQAAELLKDTNRLTEARRWLAEGTSGKEFIAWHRDRAELVKYVDDLYAAGAKEVTAIFGDPDRAGVMTMCVVHLPEAAAVRQKVFAVHEQFWKKIAAADISAEGGSDEEKEAAKEAMDDLLSSTLAPKDIGQKYLLLTFNE